MKKYLLISLVMLYILTSCSNVHKEPTTYVEVWGRLEQSESDTVWNELTEVQKEKVNYPTLHKDSVYWTPKGNSYHSIEWCYTLSRSKEIINGTLDEAMEIGKDNPCSKCVDFETMVIK